MSKAKPKAKANAKAKAVSPLVGSGFTLVELLVVITIIAILAGLVLGTAGYVQNKAARSRSESEIAAFSVALESYKADNGVYPGGANGTTASGADALYQAVTGDGDSKIGGNTTSSGQANWGKQGKVYFELKPVTQYTTTTYKVVDPWGTSYEFTSPGATNRSGTNSFDLFSTAGTSTATTNEVKWVKNW